MLQGGRECPRKQKNTIDQLSEEGSIKTEKRSLQSTKRALEQKGKHQNQRGNVNAIGPHSVESNPPDKGAAQKLHPISTENSM